MKSLNVTNSKNLDESALNFKESILKKNAKSLRVLNLQSMKLGTNAIISLATSLQTSKAFFPLTLVARQTQSRRQLYLRLWNELNKSYNRIYFS